MSKRLSDIQGIRIPTYSQEEIRSKLAREDLWDFLVNLYPDAIKKDDSTR